MFVISISNTNSRVQSETVHHHKMHRARKHASIVSQSLFALAAPSARTAGLYTCKVRDAKRVANQQHQQLRRERPATSTTIADSNHLKPRNVLEIKADRAKNAPQLQQHYQIPAI